MSNDYFNCSEKATNHSLRDNSHLRESYSLSSSVSSSVSPRRELDLRRERRRPRPESPRRVESASETSPDPCQIHTATGEQQPTGHSISTDFSG